MPANINIYSLIMIGMVGILSLCLPHSNLFWTASSWLYVCGCVRTLYSRIRESWVPCVIGSKKVKPTGLMRKTAHTHTHRYTHRYKTHVHADSVQLYQTAAPSTQWNKPVNADVVAPLWVTDRACYCSYRQKQLRMYVSSPLRAPHCPSYQSSQMKQTSKFDLQRAAAPNPTQTKWMVFLCLWSSLSFSCLYIYSLHTHCSCVCLAWLLCWWEARFYGRRDSCQAKQKTRQDWGGSLGHILQG